MFVRFWPRVDASKGATECWLWMAQRTEAGYGHIRAGGHGSRTVLAHRVSWEFANGPVPDGLFVLHACDNPPCVNPSHLFLGTALDNGNDAAAKGRSPRGERNGRAKLTESEVEEIRRIYASGGVLQKTIAAKYGVTQSHISTVVRRAGWKTGDTYNRSVRR